MQKTQRPALIIDAKETNNGIEVRVVTERNLDKQIDSTITALRARKAMLDAAIAALRADKRVGRGVGSVLDSITDEQLMAHLNKPTRGRNCRPASAVAYYRNLARKGVRIAA